MNEANTVKPFIFASENIRDSTPKLVHWPLISRFGENLLNMVSINSQTFKLVDF